MLSLLSGKIDEYEYLTSNEVFHTQKHETIEEAKFTYSPDQEENEALQILRFYS